MIELTFEEKQIFSIFQKTLSKFNITKTEVRVAGGFVRDKLLGKESSDIDIVLSDMTGQQFVTLFGWNANIVKSNPDQSKHLETAIVKMLGKSIDIVNLRSENYTDSRIPQMQFGSPLQDAVRRDLTVNAIFLNITDPGNIFIEDLVGGVEDLKNKIAKTPLDPVQTFLDDPLRILRAVRFCARFDLTPDPAMIKAANLPEVQDAFKKKISKERIWNELAGSGDKLGFLNSPNPLRAIELICEFGFRDILFFPYDTEGLLTSFDMEQNNIHHDLTVWDHTVAALKYLLTEIEFTGGSEEFLIRNLALLFHDLGKLDSRYKQVKEDGTNSFHNHEVASTYWCEQILTKQLLAPKHITERVCKLIANHCRCLMLDSDSSDKSLRRLMKDLGDDWRNLLDISLSDAYGKNLNKNNHKIKALFKEAKSRMDGLLTYQNNSTAPIRPINGFDLIAAGFSPGILMGKIFDVIDEELLENPELSKEQALDIAKKVVANVNPI